MRRLRTVPPGPQVLPALRDALAGGDAILVGSAADLPDTVEQRVALVVETSGSSGRPKRVAISADALLSNANATQAALGEPGQWVLALATNYIAGLNVLARSICVGFDPVVVEGAHFTAAGFVAAARRVTEPVRYTALVPAQLSTLLDDETATAELSAFRAVLLGGQSLPDGLRARARDAGVTVVAGYGSSETCGSCVLDGSPIGTTHVRVVDGEVWIGGAMVAEGYLGDPALTAQRFVDEQGMRWFRTADAGSWDGRRLTISGRLDDVIISGGIKVSLAAIERLLHENGYPDAVVVAGTDPRWGQTPVAFTAATADPTAAIAAIAAALGPAGRPRMRLGSSIPTLTSGKPDRARLRRTVEESTAAE